MVHPTIALIIGWFFGCRILMCLIIIVLILVQAHHILPHLKPNHQSYLTFNQTLDTFVFSSSLHD